MNLVKSFLHQNWERLNLDEHGDPDDLTYVAVTPRFRASGQVVFLILLRGQAEPSLVAKVARLKSHAENVQREALNLRTLAKCLPNEVDSLPQVIACETYKGFQLLIETALVGQLMGPLEVRKSPEHCCTRVVEWLQHLPLLTRQASDDDWFEALFERPSHLFESMIPVAAEETSLLKQTRALIWPLREMTFPRVFEHGDLSHPNIILLKEGGVGIVDWETARVGGIPAHDLFFFLAYVAGAKGSNNSNLSAFHQAFFESDSWTLPYVRAYRRQFHLPNEALKRLFVLCWFRYVITTLDRLHQFDRGVTQLSANLLQWLRASRHYARWRYAILNAEALSLNR